MLNREDVRKVLEAYKIVRENLAEGGKETEDVPFRELQELILGEIKAKEQDKDF